MPHWIRWLRCSVGLTLGGTFFSSMAQPGGPAPGGSVAVDTSVVLKIGPLELSAYAVEKNVNRFRGSGAQGGAPSADELRGWFRLFLAQQVIIAKAMAEGYGEHPEVTKMVDRMTVYMLTQAEGPFYARLYGPARTSEEVEALYARMRLVRHVVIARFPNAAEAERALGADFPAITSEERLGRLAALRERDAAAVHDGPLLWPYEPFPELGERLEKLQPGEWLEDGAGSESRYVAYLRRIEEQTLPDFATAREGFAQYVHGTYKNRVRRERRARLLREAEFAFDEGVGKRLAARLEGMQPKPGSAPEIEAAAIAGISDERLLTFTAAGAREEVTVAAFAEHFNHRFLRPGSLSFETVREMALDLAVAHLDLLEARAQRVDEEPQFKEDQKNFRNYQMLERFEKERLSPQLAISAETIAREYEANRARFTRATVARARRLAFSEAAVAARFRAQRAGADAGPAVVPADAQDLVVSRDAPVAGVEFVTEALLRGEPGSTFGPFGQPEGAIVLERGETLETVTDPLSVATPALRMELERAALNAREIELARELAGTFAIEDRIDYARYGLESGVETPWKK